MINHTSRLIEFVTGYGIFTLPYAISKCGYLFGFFMMIFTCFMTILALHLLARCSQKVHPASFFAVAKLTMPKAVILIDWAISLGCIGTGIAYLMITGSLLPEVMSQFGLTGIWLEKQFWVSIAFIICAPICYFHRISAFKWTSLIADVSIVFVVLIILLYSIPGTGLAVTCSDGTNNCYGKTETVTASLETLKVLGIFVGVFACSVNLFPVVNELKHPTTFREDIVITTAEGTALIFYLIVAFCGYGTFGNIVASNVLLEYPTTSLTNAARCLVCFQLILSYPLVCFPGRDSMMSLWHSLVLHYPNSYLTNHSFKISQLTPNSSSPLAHFHLPHSPLINLPNHTSNNKQNPIRKPSFEFTDNEVAQSSQDIQITNSNDDKTLEIMEIESSNKINSKSNNKLSNEEVNTQRKFIITTTLYLALTYTLAMTVNDLGDVQSVVGATSACMTGYILPGSCYLIMFKDDPSSPKWCRLAAIFLLCFGIFFGPTCLFCIFYLP